MSFYELNPNIYMSDAAMEQFMRLYAPSEEIGATVVRQQVVVQYDGTEGTDHSSCTTNVPNERWANMIP